jgi:hypothetical protein
MPVSLIKNTLLSQLLIERFNAMPEDREVCGAIASVVEQFQQQKATASEIQTENQLVKPLLKALGFTFEPKPKFFEDHVKGPDFALFKSDAERLKGASLWGTQSYFEHVLSLLTVKRYGRNLEEGISGFFLEFENRIPLYQSLYLTRTSKAPWAILTNGKVWILLKRPLANEKSLIEMDLEQALAEGDYEGLCLFSRLFSQEGLSQILPALLDEERGLLIQFLRNKRAVLAQSFNPATGRQENHVVARRIYGDLFPHNVAAVHNAAPGKADRVSGNRRTQKSTPVKTFDQSDVATYLFARGVGGEIAEVEKVIVDSLGDDRTKEHLLSLKILDMTPGFGNLAVRLTDSLAYLSFLLPYREKHSFVAEWENDHYLHRFVLEKILFGTVRDSFAHEVLQNSLHTRFDCIPINYRQGNPLLGMSVTDLESLYDSKSQTGLFSRHPREVMSDLRDMLRKYFALSDRIKEDVVMKAEMRVTILRWTLRIKEIMDLLTAAFFDPAIEGNKIKEMLYLLDGDEPSWEALRKTEWFHRAMTIAQRKAFFHMEIEFPFLMNGRFDMIVVQPHLTFLWEESIPEAEATKAFIKRAMGFLASTGRVLLLGQQQDDILSDLKRSRRYSIEVKEGVVIVRRRH